MARLIARSGSDRGREFVLTPDQTIGRSDENAIVLADTRLSRKNTRVWREGNNWLVEDLGSKNGTFLDGEKIERAGLEDGGELRIGETYFVFTLDPGDPAPDRSPVAAPARSLQPVASAPPLGRADDIVVLPRGGEAVNKPVGAKALTFSKHGRDGRTQTSMTWIRQDLAQRDISFKILVAVGILMLGGAMFWLVQFLIAGS